MSRTDHEFFQHQTPFNWFDQKRVLPPFDERQVICADFHDQVRMTVTSSGLTVIKSDYRAKTDESIKTKLQRRLPAHYDTPLPDIYGARFILPDDEVRNAIGIVTGMFPPEYRFPYPLPSVRDLTDPNTSRTRFSDSRYQAIHVYVAFGEEDIPNIGEVKLMTEEQLAADIETRQEYERRTRKNQMLST